MHHCEAVHGLDPWQRCHAALQVKPPSIQDGELFVEEIVVHPTVTSSWSVAADGPLISRRESLVVHIACNFFFVSFNHESGNCGALVTEL